MGRWGGGVVEWWSGGVVEWWSAEPRSSSNSYSSSVIKALDYESSASLMTRTVRWPLATNHQPSAINHRPSAISVARPPAGSLSLRRATRSPPSRRR
ncbi:MAG: hypothetical protein FJ272_18175 [Planctomycetes bacterium]|nr:hypothetical protein [Planctomycetota bacterium]MBM4086717.1 hypothetical protein [Planctomycetota bacterium]